MKLWSGQTISRLGAALSGLAVPLIATASLQATPAEMGVLAAAGSLPSLVIGLFAGAWVDRFRRRCWDG
jgi:MFS family permease